MREVSEVKNWIEGFQQSIDFIEENLASTLEIEDVAQKAALSPFYYQRIFGALCGMTVGEYIRARRMTLAAQELSSGDEKVIDVALKYGYDSPDSFAKAFQKFHGILPSAARKNGSSLKSFSRLVLKISLEGGSIMNYRIENKPEMVFVGYKRRFTGTPAMRREQEYDFWCSTRTNQHILKGLTFDLYTLYEVMTNFDEEGYDFYIAAPFDEKEIGDLVEELGQEDAKRFEIFTVPAGQYLVCETERAVRPTLLTEALRKKAVSEWLPSSGYELADAPELAVSHWFYEKGNDAVMKNRYKELWLPICQR